MRYGVRLQATASYAGRSTVGLSVYIRSMRVRLLPGVFVSVGQLGRPPDLQSGSCGFKSRPVHLVVSGNWSPTCLENKVVLSSGRLPVLKTGVPSGYMQVQILPPSFDSVA